jgi:hypothetical protein
VAPSIPATVDGLLLVGAFGSGTNATFSPPAGMLEQGELAVSSGKAKVAIEIADQMLGTAKDTGTGTRTAVADRSAVAIGQLIALRPAGPTAPPDTEKPTSPTGVTATATSSTQVGLTWTASSDNVRVDHYMIERATGTGEFAPLGTSVLTSYSDGTVSASTAYRYRVLAVDTTGNSSDPSGTSVVTTPQVPAGIVFRGASQGANTSAATLPLALPTGTLPGDVVVASIDVRGSATAAPPDGWELVRADVAGADLVKATYWHLAGSGEPASYTWTFSRASLASGVLLSYGGAKGVLPVSAGQANPSATTITAPSVTPASPGSMLIALFGSASNAAVTPPAGMTERGEVAATSGKLKVASEAADQVLPGTDPTGTRTATASKSAISIGQLVILTPVQ